MNQERIYTVLVEPHISEKVSLLGDKVNQYAFKVARDATKAEVAEAVETLFKVEVRKVTTVNVKGKVKTTAKSETRKKNWKKAYITVAAGQEIDYMVAD